MQKFSGFWALLVVGAFFVIVAREMNGQLPPFRAGGSVSAPAVSVAADGSTELLIEPSRGGAYISQILANGEEIPVLIDTGASYLTLTESDARRAGVIIDRRVPPQQFDTANGTVEAQPAFLPVLQFGPGRVDNVTVFVLPDDKLSLSLLGMNVLSRFGRLEFTPEGLTVGLE